MSCTTEARQALHNALAAACRTSAADSSWCSKTTPATCSVLARWENGDKDTGCRRIDDVQPSLDPFATHGEPDAAGPAAVLDVSKTYEAGALGAGATM
jgi:hypothetical protein